MYVNILEIFPNTVCWVSRCNNTPEAMTTPNTQILLLNINVQKGDPFLLGQKADSRTGAEKILDEPIASCCAK